MTESSVLVSRRGLGKRTASGGQDIGCYGGAWRFVVALGFLTANRCYGKRAALVPLVVMLAIAWPAKAQNTGVPGADREQIFEKAFGAKQGREQRQLLLPLIVDGRQLGHVPVILAPDGKEAEILAKPLVDALRPLIVPEGFAEIEKQAPADGRLSLEALGKAGLSARIDEATVSLVLSIPVELRQTQIINVAGRDSAPKITGLVPPATTSSYLNIRGGVDYLHAGPPGAMLGRQPLNLAFESATSVYSNVLQGDFNYSESGRHFERGDVSIVHDDPDRVLRYQAGDLAYPVTGFQAFQPLGGVTIARNFALQPYRIIQPAGQQDFVLKDASRVEVLLNGQPSQLLQLSPGRYSLRDFPFNQGVNDVQLRITDNVGRVTVVTVPYFFSNNLLAAGVSDFAYSIGVPSEDVNGLRRYLGNEPTASALHRVGITDNLTVGGNFQGNRLQQLLGGDVSMANVLGSFRFDLAGSHINGAGPDAAASLQYNYFTASTVPEFSRGVQFSAIYQGPHFAPLAVVSPFTSVTSITATGAVASAAPVSTVNPNKLNLNLGYFQTLPYKFTGGVGLSYGFERGHPDTSSVNLSLRRFLTPRLSTSLDLFRTVDTTGQTEYRALLTLTFQFFESRQFVNASYDTHQHTEQVNWQYVPPIDVGYPSANLSLSNSDQQRLASGVVNYNTSRFESSIAHDEILPVNNTAGSVDRLTSLRFGTALLFADGHYTVGRPVTDSFALVVPRSNLSGLTVGVNPVGTDFTAQTDSVLGPAAVTSLGSYQVNPVQLVVPELPIGYDVRQDVFRVVPSFRSGTVIEAGSEAVVLLDGRLVARNGRPVALAAGQAVLADSKGEKPVEFFTNRTGRFRIDGLKPGTYALSFPALPGAKAQITIPPDTKGIYRVGAIEVPIDSTP